MLEQPTEAQTSGNGVTEFGKGMDLGFLGKPHEFEPRRVYSTTGTDWQGRVDFDRMRRDRLNRARMKMEEHDLGALVCFVGENVRYITGVFQGNWKNNIFIRYCVLPRDGEPVLFETAGSDMECAKIDAPWLNGNIRPAITWKWAETAEQMMVDRMADSIVEVLKENGVEDEPIGVDIYDPSAAAAFERKQLKTTSAWPAMSGARVIKTPDEIECLKISSAIGDTSFWKIENEWLKPGVKESYITAKVNEYLYEQGFDFVYDIIVASGGNTSPYRRWHTDKVVRQGDLVIIDQNAVGPGGYFVDFVRTFKVDGKMTVKEQDLYKECYESMYAAIEQMRAGNTTADVAANFPEYADDKYGTVTLQQFAHSIGLSLYEGMWISRAYSLEYPVELKEGMYFAAETFAGHPGLEQTVRLEENLLVTEDGPVLFTRHPFYDYALS
ncbi:MAG: M24 family metallopeptidase [Solirubrobacterales bacterium]